MSSLDSLGSTNEMHIASLQGFVYVPTSSNDMIVSLVCNKFRARVSEELVVCS